MLIRAVCIYRAYGAHVSPATILPSSRYAGVVPSSMRGTPWYARRQAGPDMTTMSPERSRIGVGTTSRVRPPMRKIAALPRLLGALVRMKVGQIEVVSRNRNKWRGCANLGMVNMTHETIFNLVEVDDASIGL